MRHRILVGAPHSGFPSVLIGGTAIGADATELCVAAESQAYKLYEGTLSELLALADAIEGAAFQDRDRDTSQLQRLVRSLREGCGLTSKGKD